MNILALQLSDEDIIACELIFKNYKDIIPSYRHERIISSANKHMKAVSIYTGLLMSYIIQADTDLHINDINIKPNQYGKPQLQNVRDYNFSVSHSKNLIVCTGNMYPVGIDTEYLRSYKQKLAFRYFHPEEYSYLESIDSRIQSSEFTRLWTMKEAYIKMKGTGLFTALNSFCVIDNTCGASFENITIDNYIITTCCTKAHTIDTTIFTVPTLLDNITQIHKT